MIERRICFNFVESSHGVIGLYLYIYMTNAYRAMRDLFTYAGDFRRGFEEL